MATTIEPANPSPCVKLCALDATGRFCLGCGRTVTEIASWSRLDDAARGRIIARLDMARRVTPAGIESRETRLDPALGTGKA